MKMISLTRIVLIFGLSANAAITMLNENNRTTPVNPIVYKELNGDCILKLFSDTTDYFGIHYYCTFEYSMHIGNGYYRANCEINDSFLTISKSELSHKSSTLRLIPSKTYEKSRKIVLHSKSKLLPYDIFYNNKMYTITQKDYTINQLNDSLCIRLRINGLSTKSIKIASGKKYNIQLYENKSGFRSPEFFSNVYTSLIWGKFYNDSIVFNTNEKKLVFIRKN